jgi:hypothetical protein
MHIGKRGPKMWAIPVILKNNAQSGHPAPGSSFLCLENELREETVKS